MVQERIDLLQEIETMNGAADLTAVEDDFVTVARDYSISKGISYAAWREIGVPAVVLKRAGISRSA